MRVVRIFESYEKLRQGRVWKLLAAHLSPHLLAILQSLFLEEGIKSLPGSVLTERLTRDIDALRGLGKELPKFPQAYLADWLAEGWLTRRLPVGASEEEYELTAEAVSALRYVATLERPRASATESRLTGVMQQVLHLAQETDTNPRTRLAALFAERERLDREIATLEKGSVSVLPDERAVERAREIIALAQELAADFRNVRDAFERLNRNLRQSLMEHDGSRGAVLETLFDGIDVIAESEQGRAFNAFWRLLNDGEQAAAFDEALDAVTSRGFARKLEPRERRFLQNFTVTLMKEGGEVHEVLQQFARSLKTFVQSREFQERRRLHLLLREALQASLAVRNVLRPNAPLGYELTRTSCDIDSVSRWGLFDPAMHTPDAAMQDAPASTLSLEAIGELVKGSEIDLRTLADHVRSALQDTPQISIGALLQRFPAEQGFGSVVGYVALGVNRGEVTSMRETVNWVGTDGVERRAELPAIFFLKESFDELGARS